MSYHSIRHAEIDGGVTGCSEARGVLWFGGDAVLDIDRDEDCGSKRGPEEDDVYRRERER